jgi:hypothetical protein
MPPFLGTRLLVKVTLRSSGGRDPRDYVASSSIPSVLQAVAYETRDADRDDIRGPTGCNRPLRRGSRRGSRCSRDHRLGSNDVRRKPCLMQKMLGRWRERVN